MGKSNRIKSTRAVKVSSAPAAKQKKGVPSWLYTVIALVIAIAVLSTVVVGILSANGVFLRMTTTMKTENHKVSGNMMTYYLNTNIQNFQSNYSTYINAGYFSADFSKSLKDQTFGQSATGATVYDTMLLGSFSGTWYDYFLEQTKTQVREMLVYAEEATARNITLDENDLATIDGELAALEVYAETYGYPFNTYIGMNFGEGVREGDVRDALELSALATKCVNIINDEFDAALSFDSQDIKDKYEANKKDYNVVDYSYYTWSVDYDEAVEEVLGADATDDEIASNKDAIAAKYKELVAEKKAKADALKLLNTQADFEKYIINEYVTTSYDDVLKAEKVSAENKPSAEDEEAIKQAIMTEIIDAVAKGEKLPDLPELPEDAETVELYGKTVKKAYAKNMYAVRSDLYEDTDKMTDSRFVESAKYSSTDFSKWAFETEENSGTRAQFDVMEDASDYKETDEVKEESEYSISIYMLTKTQAPDTEKAKDLTFATFSTEDAAKAFIEALKAQGETSNAEAFNKLAGEKHAVVNDVLENYIKGSMSSAAFDNWVFSDISVGDYSSTPIKVEDGMYVVLLYTADGEENWKVNVKQTLLSEKLESNYQTMLSKYAPIDKPKAMARLETLRYSKAS